MLSTLAFVNFLSAMNSDEVIYKIPYAFLIVLALKTAFPLISNIRSFISIIAETAVLIAVIPCIAHPMIYNTVAEPGNAIKAKSFNNPESVPITIPYYSKCIIN